MPTVKYQKEMTFLEAIDLLKNNFMITQIHSLDWSSHININEKGMEFFSESESITFNEKFLVEVDQEFDESTKFPKVLFNFNWLNKGQTEINSQVRNNFSIEDVLKINGTQNKKIRTIYCIDNTGRTNLIWSEGRMIG